MSRKQGSYGQILKTSSIIGGAQGINYLIGMFRTKLLAVLLGPAGIGLVGLYSSITTMVAAFAGLGIGSSGVRDVAEAAVHGGDEQVGKIVKTLRRVCWGTGILGWLIMAAFSRPLSLWIFQSPVHAWTIAALGVTVLVGEITMGQMVFIQGMRRISDLARVNIFSMVSGTLIAVGIYAWQGEKGILPVLVLTAIVNLVFSSWYAKKITIPEVSLTLRETWMQLRSLLKMGTAFMWSGLLTTAVVFATRTMIVKTLGLDANGIYQAAWGISGMFAGFILGAMGTDFFPRLTAVASDHSEVNRLVNEQTEVGILLALPGILGTLSFAPLLMRIFYSSQFLPAAELLPWFVLGVFGRVVSWPMGFILLAKGMSKWFVISETLAAIIQLSLTYIFLHWLGLRGVAVAFAILYFVSTFGLCVAVGRLTNFRWSPASVRLLVGSSLLVAAGFFIQSNLKNTFGIALGGGLTLASGIYCLRGIAERLGPQHRVLSALKRVPFLSRLCLGKSFGNL